MQKIDARRSWIQLAKTGQWKSKRYGTFAITKDDLSQMYHNFNEVTPTAPTELPIDYDHMSMDPKKPGDGIAAGWMKKLELRKDGQELWAEVEWTPGGATKVDAKEYRFVSPSFVKNHTHKDGTKIGTTLLAAAITNHPFLEGMSALTLYNFSSMGDIALNATDEAAEPINLSEVGQRVMIAPGHARTMDETGGTFEIVEVVGQGDDSFVSLKDANGVVHKWFRATELLAASATPMPAAPNLQPGQPNPDAAGAPGAPAVPGAPGAQPPGAPGSESAATANPEVAAQIAAAGEQAKAAALANGATPEEADAAAAQASTEAQKKLETDAAASEKSADGNGEKKIGDAKTDGDKPTDDDEKDATADGVGAKKTVASKTETSHSDDASEEDDPIKKAVAALLGVKPAAHKPAKEGITHMSQKFMLRNDKNEEVEYTAEQLAAAGIRVVPEGSTVIGTKELSDLTGQVTNLSSRLDTMAAATETAVKNAAHIELKSELDRLSTGGFITKPMRDYAETTWKDATDLAAFHAWKSPFTTPIVNLNKEHGSGAGGGQKDAGQEASEQLIQLSHTIARDKGITLREAMIQASAQLPQAAEAYREQFANA